MNSGSCGQMGEKYTGNGFKDLEHLRANMISVISIISRGEYKNGTI